MPSGGDDHVLLAWMTFERMDDGSIQVQDKTLVELVSRD